MRPVFLHLADQDLHHKAVMASFRHAQSKGYQYNYPGQHCDAPVSRLGKYQYILMLHSRGGFMGRITPNGRVTVLDEAPHELVQLMDELL